MRLTLGLDSWCRWLGLPGRGWFTVVSGTALLHLGDWLITVKTGQAAE